MPRRRVVGWAFPCVVASLLLVVMRFCLCVPLPPVAGETLAMALSPVDMWVPVRPWGSSPPAAGVVCAPRARRVAALPLRVVKSLGEMPLAAAVRRRAAPDVRLI